MTSWSPYPAVSWVSSPVVPTPRLSERRCRWRSNPRRAGLLSSRGSSPLCWAGVVVVAVPTQWWCGYRPSPSGGLSLAPVPSEGPGIVFGWILAPPLGSRRRRRRPYPSAGLASSSSALNPLGWVSSMAGSRPSAGRTSSSFTSVLNGGLESVLLRVLPLRRAGVGVVVVPIQKWAGFGPRAVPGSPLGERRRR